MSILTALSRRPKRAATLAIAAVLVCVAAMVVPDLLRVDVWTRPHPLPGAIVVESVARGVLTLADGRRLRPAGVIAHPDVDPAAYDEALRIACSQGVVVLRELGDGRAFLQAEPKFYHWCGNRGGYGLNPFARWAGEQLQTPLSEFLIVADYAVPAANDPALTAHERWRLEGAAALRTWSRDQAGAMEYQSDINAFRKDLGVIMFDDYDGTCAGDWKKPPAE